MESLRENWLTEGLIDFEYKKYLLLGYLKRVKDSFQRVELYPFLADMVFHYRNMMALKENKALIFDKFPKQLSLDNLKNLEINYKKIIEDDAIMRELESIIEFSLPKLKTSLDEGSFIYDYVESQCEISPIGLTSLYANEGYLFIAQPPQKQTDVYRYAVTIFDNSNEQMRSINTQLILKAEKSFSNTYEQMKLHLIREYTDLPNPANVSSIIEGEIPDGADFNAGSEAAVGEADFGGGVDGHPMKCYRPRHSPMECHPGQLQANHEMHTTMTRDPEEVRTH